MKNPLFETARPLNKFLFLIFIVLVSLLLFLGIGLLIGIPLFNIDIENFNNYFTVNNPKNISFMKFMQAFQSIGIFVLPPFVAGYLYSNNVYSYLEFNKIPLLISLLISGILIFTILPFVNFTAEINSNLSLPAFLSGLENMMRESEKSAELITKAFLSVTTIKGLIINIIIVALIPAVGEELLFRGVIQKLFTEWFKNIHLGIIVAGILFSAIHFQFYGFLPRALLGILFGYLFFWSKNIWVPIFAHFVNNATGVIAYYYFQINNSMEKVEKLGTEITQYPFLFGTLLLTIFFIFIFKKGVANSV